jgi:hypothetical protein
MQAGLDRTEPERHVLAVRRRDDRQVVRVGRREQVVGGREDLDPGMRRARLRGPLRIRGDDRGEREARNGLDERRVERRPREAVADQADTERRQTRPAA